MLCYTCQQYIIHVFDSMLRLGTYFEGGWVGSNMKSVSKAQTNFLPEIIFHHLLICPGRYQLPVTILLEDATKQQLVGLSGFQILFLAMLIEISRNCNTSGWHWVKKDWITFAFAYDYVCVCVL